MPTRYRAAPPASPAGPDDMTVLGVFPARYRIGPADADGRCEVSDPASNRRWKLGPGELLVARRFDGARSYAEVAAATTTGGRPAVPAQAARRFEARLLRLGILEPGGGGPGGASRADRYRHRLARRLRAVGTIEFAGGDPTRMLDRWSRSVRRLTGRGPVLLVTVYVLATPVLLRAHVGDLAGEVRPALEGAGLLGLAAAFVASAVFHEGGHALACHRYAVGVERIGIGLRWFVPFAWTRPDQDAWRRLPARDRVVTAVAGPLGSLVFAALGGSLWYAAHDVEAFRLAGLYSVVAGTVGMAPTLVPTFEGDAYLLLEMWLGKPNLRRRSFEHLLGALTGAPRPGGTGRGAHLLYVAFALTSALLCAAATCCVLGAVYWFAIAPMGGW